MTIPSKLVGGLSLFSCIKDIHTTSMLMSKKEYGKASADAFLSNSVGCQKTNYLSVKDAKRKNWLLRQGIFVGINENFGGVRGYLKGVQQGIMRYLPNFILAGFSIIPKKHKVLANLSAAALGILELCDYFANGTNMNEKTDYLK